MNELNLEFPWPPSVNHYKKIGRIIKTNSGKIYQQKINSDKTKTFYYQTYLIAKQIMPLEWAKFACSKEISFEVRVSLHPPDKKRRDIDNCLKVLLDSLVRANVIIDDSKINRLFVEKMENVLNGKVFIKILPILNEKENKNA